MNETKFPSTKSKTMVVAWNRSSPYPKGVENTSASISSSSPGEKCTQFSKDSSATALPRFHNNPRKLLGHTQITTKRKSSSSILSSRKAKHKIGRQERSASKRSRSAFSCPVAKIKKKRKTFPVVPGQFDDAHEESIANGPGGHQCNPRLFRNTHLHPMIGDVGRIEQKANSWKEFAMDFRQRQPQRQQQHSKQGSPLPPKEGMDRSAVPSLHNEGTMELLQMELLLKVIKANIEYNEGLLADATRKRLRQRADRNRMQL